MEYLLLILVSTTLFANTNLKVIVNQKHTKPINLITKSEKYIFTYSTSEQTLKIWDNSVSTPLLKSYNNIKSLVSLTIFKGKVFIMYNRDDNYDE